MSDSFVSSFMFENTFVQYEVILMGNPNPTTVERSPPTARTTGAVFCKPKFVIKAEGRRTRTGKQKAAHNFIKSNTQLS